MYPRMAGAWRKSNGKVCDETRDSSRRLAECAALQVAPPGEFHCVSSTTNDEDNCNDEEGGGGEEEEAECREEEGCNRETTGGTVSNGCGRGSQAGRRRESEQGTKRAALAEQVPANPIVYLFAR